MTAAVGVFSRIDDRVSLPGDSETRRFQKVLVVLVALAGSVATLFNAIPLFTGGLSAMGWTLIASAVYLFSGAVILLVWPRTFVVVTFVLLSDVLIFTPLAQVFSGGLSSGMYAMPWALFAPLGAALVLGLRPALVHLVLFVVVVLIVAALEPYAVRTAPELTTSAIVSYNVPSLISLGVMAAATSFYLLRQVEHFRDQADALLFNVLPTSIASRLKAGETPIADGLDGVTVLFADIVDFTRISSNADPNEIVTMLDDIFSQFDALAARHGVEKIKTIGDAYMAAAGVPLPRPDHTEAVIAFALDILAAVDGKACFGSEAIHLRIGINTGPVVAGVIGRERFIYDLWGDTVNVASRMESHGLADKIQVTRAVRERVGDRYRFEERPPIDIKGKGLTVTYALLPDAPSREHIDVAV